MNNIFERISKFEETCRFKFWLIVFTAAAWVSYIWMLFEMPLYDRAFISDPNWYLFGAIVITVSTGIYMISKRLEKNNH